MSRLDRTNFIALCQLDFVSSVRSSKQARVRYAVGEDIHNTEHQYLDEHGAIHNFALQWGDCCLIFIADVPVEHEPFLRIELTRIFRKASKHVVEDNQLKSWEFSLNYRLFVCTDNVI